MNFTNVAIVHAARQGSARDLERLLRRPNANPSWERNWALNAAAHCGHLDAVRMLLEDPRGDPASGGGSAIVRASVNGHIGVLVHLLADSRISPGAYNNWSVAGASCHGRTEVVKILLRDSRVNAAARSNLALRLAEHEGHQDIAELLLHDSRVLSALSAHNLLYYARKHDWVAIYVLQYANQYIIRELKANATGAIKTLMREHEDAEIGIVYRDLLAALPRRLTAIPRLEIYTFLHCCFGDPQAQEAFATAVRAAIDDV
jgi:ankyrin repeat protein